MIEDTLERSHASAFQVESHLGDDTETRSEGAYLEDSRSDDDKDKERQQLGGHRVSVVLLRGLADVATLGDVLGIFLVGLAHLRSHRHLGGCGGGDGAEEGIRLLVEAVAWRDCAVGP